MKLEDDCHDPERRIKKNHHSIMTKAGKIGMAKHKDVDKFSTIDSLIDGNFFSTLEGLLNDQERKQIEYEKRFPKDVPNEASSHAFLYGLSIENSFRPKVGEYNHFFSTNYESIFVWTYKKHTNSALVSVVDSSIKEAPFWKTAGRLLQLAYSYVEAFESAYEPIDYKWMYYFNFETSDIDEIEFLGLEEFESRFLSNGRQIKVTDVANMASLIELFDRDDRAYNAVSLVKSAFDVHWCCLICELSSHPFHDHLSQEPKQWNQADILQNIELSIVQSCRAVECILGQPPNRQNQSSVLRHKERWFELIGIDPDGLFEKAGESYLDFYYRLFVNLRNPSAHSYGNTNYALQRIMAVRAQCFAAIVLRGYINNNMVDNAVALKKLHFNLDFLSRVSDSMSTRETIG